MIDKKYYFLEPALHLICFTIDRQFDSYFNHNKLIVQEPVKTDLPI